MQVKFHSLTNQYTWTETELKKLTWHKKFETNLVLLINKLGPKTIGDKAMLLELQSLAFLNFFCLKISFPWNIHGLQSTLPYKTTTLTNLTNKVNTNKKIKKWAKIILNNRTSLKILSTPFNFVNISTIRLVPILMHHSVKTFLVEPRIFKFESLFFQGLWDWSVDNRIGLW